MVWPFNILVPLLSSVLISSQSIKINLAMQNEFHIVYKLVILIIILFFPSLKFMNHCD